jgi:cardiolipin synthase (CMP-forming)
MTTESVKTDRESKSNFVTAANALTASRLVLLPVVIAGLVEGYGRGWLAPIAMGLIVLTDLLDGRVARHMHQQSRFGGALDSTIDFILIYSLFITFYAIGLLATYQFAVLFVAMLTTFLLQMVAMGSGTSEGILRTRTGKITGALQYGYILFLVTFEVLPAWEGWDIINLAWFTLLAIFICLSSSGAIIRMRRMI